MTKVRAKFLVNKISHHSSGKQANGQTPVHTIVEMVPVYSTDPTHENKKFTTSTPSGKFEMTLGTECTPEVKSFFEVGSEYYLDFTKAPEQV